MLSATAPTEIDLIAGFRPRPDHKGSIHDDASARQYGYRSALVPGIILYGYMADLIAASWGLDWVERGTMNSHSRRPVYEGDAIRIVAAPVEEDASGRSVALEIHDAEGRTVATGRAGLASAKPETPDLRDFPVQPISDPLPPIAAGEFRPGNRFGCAPETVTEADHQESLAYFRQTWPVFTEQHIVHPTRFPHIATRNALHSYALPTPSIFVSATTQHLGLARVGDRLTTSGMVTNAYERKGNHYTDQQHLVIANGNRPVAFVTRTSIYAARKGA